MKTVMIAGAAALSLMGGVAFAQTSSETVTTQTSPYVAPPAVVVVPPAPGVLSTTRTTRTQDAYGNQVNSQSTTYNDGQGVAQDSTTTTRVVPPPVVSSTTTTETTTQHN
jgi:hypothetical protein